MNTKLLSFILATLSLCILSGCTRISPGHVGILIDNAGSNRGVLNTPVKTGWVWYMPGSSTVIEYPTFINTAKWTQNANEGKQNVDESITFTNKDSMTFNVDVSLSYSLLAEQVPAFYVKFHTEDLTTFTDGFLRNVARDCFNEHAGKYAVEQIMGDNAPFITDTRKCIQDQVGPYGVKLEQFGFIGAPRPPQNIIDAINMKVQAQQLTYKKQMELTQVQADVAKQVAAAEGEARAKIAGAEGDAKANQIRNASITDKLLDWRRLDNQNAAIWRWNGTMPETYVGSGDGKLLFNVPANKETK